MNVRRKLIGLLEQLDVGDEYREYMPIKHGDDVYSQFLEWSDFLWAYERCEEIQEQFDNAGYERGELSLELFVDRDGAEEIASHLTDITNEASYSGHRIIIDELTVGARGVEPEKDSAVYVATISADWCMAIERYEDEFCPAPSAAFVAICNKDFTIRYVNNAASDALNESLRIAQEEF